MIVEPLIPLARPPRRRMARGTAKQLDRLSRGAHRFHRFAHHPLCDRYTNEVVRAGRVRLCRGCTYAIAGGLFGGVAGLVIGASVVTASLATGAGFALLMSTLYAKRRPSKLVTRLVPAALFALAMTCGVLSLSPLGLSAALGAAAIVVGMRVLYGKRGPDRRPCATCPERSWSDADAPPPGDAVCSGFAPIVRREAAFQRAARNLLAR